MTSSASLRRGHRWLAWPAAGTLLLWAASGLLHPVMSWTQPRPAEHKPPVTGTFALPEARAFGPRDPGRPWIEARWVLWKGEPLLRTRRSEADTARYLRSDGRSADLGVDADRARWLGAHYLGTRALSSVTPVTAFDADYAPVHRVLPVWRVVDERGRRAYVDTASDRLVRLSDSRQQVLQSVFRQVHTLAFLEAMPRLRLALLSALLLGVLVTAGLGLRMLLRRGGRHPGRRAHRLLAGAALLPLLIFAPTGLLHLWTAQVRPALSVPPQAAHQVEALRSPAGRFSELQWIPAGVGEGRWRGRKDGEIVHYAASGEPLAPDDAALAVAVAAAHGFAEAQPLELVRRFDADYGFINRRLPVWRLRHGDRLLHVDLASGWLASTADRLQRLEQRSFSLLHKWGALDALGRAGRDLVMSLAAALLVVLALSGLRLRWRSTGR